MEEEESGRAGTRELAVAMREEKEEEERVGGEEVSVAIALVVAGIGGVLRVGGRDEGTGVCPCAGSNTAGKQTQDAHKETGLTQCNSGWKYIGHFGELFLSP